MREATVRFVFVSGGRNWRGGPKDSQTVDVDVTIADDQDPLDEAARCIDTVTVHEDGYCLGHVRLVRDEWVGPDEPAEGAS